MVRSIWTPSSTLAAPSYAIPGMDHQNHVAANSGFRSHSVLSTLLERFPTLPELAAAECRCCHGTLGWFRLLRPRSSSTCRRQSAVLSCVATYYDRMLCKSTTHCGRSTAATILSQAWNDRAPILDGNIKRCTVTLAWHRWLVGSINDRKRALGTSRSVCAASTNRTSCRLHSSTEWISVLTVCTRLRPACLICPLQDGCVAWREGLTGDLTNAQTQ